MQLAGASVVVTGGSRGLGPRIAKALLERGARVTLAARSGDDLDRVKASLDGSRVATVAADVSSEADRERILSAAEDAFGAVDVLVNNAGIEDVFADIARYRPEEIEAIVRVNLEAPIQLCRLVVPGMVSRRRGHVVNMASSAGKAAVPWNTVYSATKHGLIGFSYGLRAELRDTGVGVSAICPGFVLDEGGYARRGGRPPPKGSGTTTTSAAVAEAVVEAIERNAADKVVGGLPLKLADVVLALSPDLLASFGRLTGNYNVLRRQAEQRLAREQIG